MQGRIVFATGNAGKIKEIRMIMEDTGMEVVSMKDAGIMADIDENGKMCLPGKGITDFYDLFSRLNDVGFDGALLLEVYQNDYKEFKELFDSLSFIEETADRVFK